MAKLKDTEQQDLHQWGLSLVEDGRHRRIGMEGQWWENIATFSGDFWVEWNPHDRKLKETPKPDHKVRLAINLAQPVIRTEYAKILKNKPITDVLARSNEKTDVNAAKVGNKVLNHYVEREFHMARVRRRAVWWTLVCGLGGIFVDYDDTLKGKTEVVVDPSGAPIFDPATIKAIQRHYRERHRKPKTMEIPQGDLRMVPVSPFELLWDYSQNFMDDAWWCIVSQVYDVAEAKRRWDVELNGNPKVLPGILEQRVLSRFDKTIGAHRMNIRPPKAQDLAEVHRLFIRPGHPDFPNGAEVIFTEDQFVEAKGFPYGHGQLPVSVMGHVPFPVSQHPLSVLQAIKGPVLELSRTESQLVENRNLMGNPPWREAEQHRIEKPIVNKPGLRIKYTHVPNIPPPEPVTMPEMPGYVQNLVPTMREHVLEISGQGETSQGRVPAGARSGVAIAYLQEEDDTRLGPTIAEFEEMIERASTQILSLIAERYDAPRTITIYKKNSEPEVFDFMGSMLQNNTSVIVQAGSALPRSKAAKQQFILDLYDRGLEQDPRRVRMMLELSEGDPDEWEVDIDQAERENRTLMSGQEVRVEDWYNHPAHRYAHQHFMKSPDFDSLPEPVQELFRAHNEAHIRAEQDQQQRMAQMQMMNGAGGAPPSVGNGEVEIPTANGQTNQELPAQFTSQISPRSLLENGPA